MTFHSVKDMLNQASNTSVLDTLAPKDFVVEISNQLLSLADEFPSVSLKITKENVPQFCTDLRAGQRERVIEELVSKGHDEQDLRDAINPQDFEMPRRIETYAAVYPAVELSLSARIAHLLASDLARGVACRQSDTDKETPHAEQD